MRVICYILDMPRTNRKAAIKRLKTLVFTPKSEVTSYRAMIEKTFCTPFLPNKVERTKRNFGGIPCDLLAPEIYSSKRIMFYIHGGCFAGGSCASYRSFCAVLANKAFSRIVIPEYRLAPEHPFPAAIEDVQTAFRSLFTEEQIARSLDTSPKQDTQTAPDAEKNEPQPEIIIAADGAGASIAMALILNLRERYRKCIKKVVFFSPWFNLSSSSPVLSGKKVSDEILSSDILQKCAFLYTYETNMTNPLVSPVYAAKDVLEQFPPVYIQIGSKEILLEDAKAMAKRLEEAGSSCTIDVQEDMPHLFQMADDYIEQAHDALQKCADVISGTEQFFERQTFENKPRLENSLSAEA